MPVTVCYVKIHAKILMATQDWGPGKIYWESILSFSLCFFEFFYVFYTQNIPETTHSVLMLSWKVWKIVFWVLLWNR